MNKIDSKLGMLAGDATLAAPSGHAFDRARRFCDVPVVPDIPIDLRTQTFRRDSFPAAGPLPWLDLPDAREQIELRFERGEIDAQDAALCRQWQDQGYLILEGFYERGELDQVWNEYESAIETEAIKPPGEPLFAGDTVPGRVLNPHLLVDGIRRILFDARMGNLVSMLLGAKALPFQTIAGHKSSKQLQHSDSIHMTTYPSGFLLANWIAFEDIHPDSGPLVYHPRSHKLPYLLSEDLGIPFDAGYRDYHRVYEPAIQKLIIEKKLESRYFVPAKGDVLLWHANLLHGGSQRNS